MHKVVIVAMLAGTIGLGACATSRVNNALGDAGTGAAASGGAALATIVPGVSVADGALVGAAIGGLSNAVWADQNNDGAVDGYVQNGSYYPGTPPGYDPALRLVAPGAAGAAMPQGGSTGMPASSAPATMPAPTAAPGSAPARGERG